MPLNSRKKGQRGEREIIDWLQPIVSEYYEQCGWEAPVLQRNTIQSDAGGYDIVGLDWFSPEVKWCEVFQCEAWWAQCVGQAKPHQTPVLFYKRNHVEWRVRMFGWLGRKQDAAWSEGVVDVDRETFEEWFRTKLMVEITQLKKLAQRAE